MNPSLNNRITAMHTFFATVVPLLSETATFLLGAIDPLPDLSQHLSPFLFASAVSDLKDKLREVLNIIMLFGFLVGTIRIIGGANQMRRGDTEEGKSSIVGGALIAAAPLIMRILFEIFFGGGGLF